MNNDFYSLNPKKLGFGLMRLPLKEGSIDYELAQKMADYYIKSGFCYFDTAYMYHGGESEKAVKKLLTERYPRDSYYLASKLPAWFLSSEEDNQKIFDKQRERTGVDYFDFYLLHALDCDNIKAADKHNSWNFLIGLKERGLAKHIGFSFHGTADELDMLLTTHPEMEFVQLQLNYADWNSDQIQSRKCYETARKHNKPIIVMEPIKGGSLAEFGPAEREIFESCHPDMSLASWALRYVLSLDGVFCVLSGMSSMEQMEENIDIAQNFVPMNDEEYKVIDAVVEKSKETPTIPCTGCNYCYEACPQKIDTPNMITNYNNYLRYKYLDAPKRSYHVNNQKGFLASDCIQCGECEARCPQNIKIIDTLKDIADLFES